MGMGMVHGHETAAVYDRVGGPIIGDGARALDTSIA